MTKFMGEVKAKGAKQLSINGDGDGNGKEDDGKDDVFDVSAWQDLWMNPEKRVQSAVNSFQWIHFDTV